METIQGFFDVFSVCTDILNRQERKDTELMTLCKTSSTIWSSVKGFLDGLPDAERSRLFQDNMIWSELHNTLTACHEILSRNAKLKDGTNGHHAGAAGPNGSSSSSAPPPGSCSSNGTAVETRSRLTLARSWSGRAFTECTQALSSKVGRISEFLKLPADELAEIQEANQLLDNLVNKINLAMLAYIAQSCACHGPGGMKRLASADLDDRPEAQRQRPNGMLSRASFGRSGSLAQSPQTTPESLESLPRLRLQLFHNHKDAPEGLALPELSCLHEFHAAAESQTVSFEKGRYKRIFGRKEINKYVPEALTLFDTTSNRPQPLTRFVSRDLISLEVIVPDMDATIPLMPEPEPLSQMDTLPFPGLQDDSQFLQDNKAKPVVKVQGLTPAGVHVRSPEETIWRWCKKEDWYDARPGDLVAVLMNPIDQRQVVQGMHSDIEVDKVICLLGLRVIALEPPSEGG